MAMQIDKSGKIVFNFEHEAFVRNPSIGEMYANAVQQKSKLFAKRTIIAESGALIAYSSEKTGRSPTDKRVVKESSSEKDVWWGPVNIPMEETSYEINRRRAVDYLNTRPRIYIIDGYAGWDPASRIKVRIVCARSYHALFMRNMLIRPSLKELEDFGNPDYTILNAGEFPANPLTKGVSSAASIDVNFAKHEMVILGTQYAGEMKKGVFTIMHYLMPKRGILSLHSSANEGKNGDVTLLFGLSGTGKTTLSADPHRALIGDDEHCWSDQGVFNIEGGCYAKCVGLTPEKEPEIYQTIRFGSVLENVVVDPKTRQVDFFNTSITENTRLCYPIEYMPNVKIPCVAGHPKNIIFLTCDASGVLPPVSKLNSEQAMYHFISGYTSKVAGTEQGVTEPKATFSACFGEAFLVFHPTHYAEMLAEKMSKHQANAWLINTGWTGGGPGTGHRMSLKHTRAILDAIHDGSLEKAQTKTLPYFNVAVPTTASGVPSDVMYPENAWKDKSAYDKALKKLAGMFVDNFAKYEGSKSAQAIKSAGPKL